MKYENFGWDKLMEYLYTGNRKYQTLKGLAAEKLFGEGKEFRGRLQLLENMLNSNSKLIVDLGCAGAYPARYLTKKGRKNSFICIDINPNYIKFAKSRIKENNNFESKIELIVASCTNLPLRDNVVNTAIGIGLFEYLNNKESNKCLDEIKRVTNEEIILTFTSKDLEKRFYYRLGLPQFFMKRAGIPYHKLYTEDEVNKLFQTHNLKCEIYTSGKWNISARAKVNSIK